MKLAQSWSKFNSICSSPGHYHSRALRVLLYSTETLKSSPISTSKDTLYRRISSVGDPRVSIVPILDKWIEEGNTVTRDELQSIVKELKGFRRFRHALEVSQWMSDRRYFTLTPGICASRVYLISKVHGLEKAEKYFDNIPKQLKTSPPYGALLSSYVHYKSVEKAEALMQKMRYLGYANTSRSYNFMLNLYRQAGQYEKLDTLMQEMKEKGIHWDKFTFVTLLSACTTISDIDRMEKILKKMEEDSTVIKDWNCYAVAANGYVKAGLNDKALEMLKRSEELMTGKKGRAGYDFLLTLYASIGKKEELYRIWNLCKSYGKIYNPDYIYMIDSLLKLDDFSGAEKILEEWESGGTSDDFRVPNLLILAYCKKGLLEKAEKMINEAVERGMKARANTWDALATGYLEDNQIQKAVETMKKAILASHPGWKPNRVTLAACLEYMKGKGDVEGAREFVKSLGSPGPFSMDICEKLLNYIEDGNPASLPINDIDENGLDDVNEATSRVDKAQAEGHLLQKWRTRC